MGMATRYRLAAQTGIGLLMLITLIIWHSHGIAVPAEFAGVAYAIIGELSIEGGLKGAGALKRAQDIVKWLEAEKKAAEARLETEE